MQFTVDWMEGYGNDPRFRLHGVHRDVGPGPDDPVWEQRNGVHRYDGPFFVHYFYNDMSGKPTHGFGGARFSGTFKDGSKFSYVGAWSSRASVVNMFWPDDPIVEVKLVESHLATAVKCSALIEWVKQNKPGWGLAWVRRANGEFGLKPTRDGKLKREPYSYETVLHLEL